MKLFRFRGGVHPAYHKQESAGCEIQPFPLPKRLYIPLQQHIGAPAEPEVSVGNKVLKGQLLAHSQGLISAPVHAPSSGTIIAIDEHTAPHPSGLPVRTIILETDGEDRWGESAVPIDPFRLPPEEVSAEVGRAGIVGLGGATFPSAVKLHSGLTQHVHTLVLNGAECEPYLTCDDRLMRERAEQVIDGIRIMLHAMQTARAMVAIEDNKPEAIEVMRTAAKHCGNIEIVKVPTRYPMGSEKQIIKTLTGEEVPAGGRTSDIGIVVHNVGTAYAVHRAVRYGRPLISRVVTVAGDAIRFPANLEVPLGTPVSELLEFCGLKEDPARLLMGGPMMGQVLPSAEVPIIKGSSGVIALTQSSVAATDAMPCIRCGSCVTACPCGLLPLEMSARARKDDLDGAVDYGLLDCISCGSCAYVCPSHIPLVQYFNYAKGALAARQRDQQKNDKTKRLAQQRQERMDRIAKQKAEEAARRKAEKAAKEAAAAAQAGETA